MPPYKVILVGTTNVGKTSILRALEGVNNASTTSTTSMQIHSISTYGPDGTDIVINFWDTAGQEQYKSVGPIYYQNSNACIAVFDITAPATKDEMMTYIENYKSMNENSVIIIAANKSDLENHSDEEIDDHVNWAEGKGYRIFFTSARTGEGIAELLTYVSSKVVPVREFESLPSVKVDNSQPFYQKFCC